MNLLYPVFLDLTGKRTVIVGGGEVASRKAAALLQCGAGVIVVAPEISGEIDRLAETGRLEIRKHPFEPSDVEGAAIAVAACDDSQVNAAVYSACRAAGILCNVVDDPSRCDFHVPAVVSRGDLKIAVSTGGRAPAFAAALRAKLENLFGERYENALRILGEKRDLLLSRGADGESRRREMIEAARSDKLWDYLEGRRGSLSAEEL